MRRRRCSRASGSSGCAPRTASELRADAVVLAAGAWSGSAEWLPEPPARRCARSRARSSSCAAATAPAPCERIVASERVYLVPRADGRLIVGATVEEQRLRHHGHRRRRPRAAARGLPPAPRASPRWSWSSAIAGPAPRHPRQPAADRPGRVDGLILATGHYRNGILLAPLTAERSPRCWRAAAPWRSPAGSARPRVEERRAMRIELNGEARELRRGATLADAVREAGAGADAPRRRRRARRRGRAARRVGGDARCARARRRGARRDPGRRRRRWELGGRQWSLAADRRHRRLPLAGADGGGAAPPPGPRSSPSRCAASTPPPRARCST